MYLFYKFSLIFLLNIVLIILLFSTFISTNRSNDIKKNRLIVITVATEPTDGFVRFNRSVNTYGLKLEVLGMNQKWLGGNVAKTAGGGHKVNLLKNFIRIYKNEPNLVVLFVDSYDLILTATSDEILKRFFQTDAQILFSSEEFCWPDKSLESEYPKSDREGKHYLNSGGFMGYAPQIHQMVSTSEIKDSDDDQLFYTKIYIDNKLRKELGIKLDQKSNIFQNLNGAIGDVEIRFNGEDSYIHNTAYQTNPIVIHGNGASKVALNSLGNYLAKSWHPKYGCLSCNENKISLEKIPESEYPVVLIGIFVRHTTPFFTEFLESVVELKYPKKRIHLYLYNNVSYHTKDVQNFIDHYRDIFGGVTVFASDRPEWQARNSALDECVKTDCDYYFSLDSDARITNPLTLIKLIEQNRAVIAPLLVRHNELWSNFWGSLSAEGYYSRSHDYVQIVKNERREKAFYAMQSVEGLSSKVLFVITISDE